MKPPGYVAVRYVLTDAEIVVALATIIVLALVNVLPYPTNTGVVTGYVVLLSTTSLI